MIRRTSVKELALPKGDAKRFLRELEAEGFIEIHRYQAGSRDPDLIFPGDLRILVSFPSPDRPLSREEKIERRRNHDQRLFPFMDEEQNIVPIGSPVSMLPTEQMPGSEIVPPCEVQKLSAISAPPETNRPRGAKNEHDIPRQPISPRLSSNAVKSASSEPPKYGIDKRQPLDLTPFKFLFPVSDATVDCRKDEETTSESVQSPATNEVQKLSAIFEPPGINRSRGAKNEHDIPNLPILPTLTSDAVKSTSSEPSEFGTDKRQPLDLTPFKFLFPVSDATVDCRKDEETTSESVQTPATNEVQKLSAIFEPPGTNRSRGAKIDPRCQVQKMPLVPAQNGTRHPISSRSREWETTVETSQHPCTAGVTTFSSCPGRGEISRQAAAVKPVHAPPNDGNEVQKLPLVSEPSGQETSKNAKPYNISNIQFEIFEYSQIHQIPQICQIEELELLDDFQSERIDKLEGPEWIKKRIQLSATIENEFTAAGIPFPKESKYVPDMVAELILDGRLKVKGEHGWNRLRFLAKSRDSPAAYIQTVLQDWLGEHTLMEFRDAAVERYRKRTGYYR